MNDSSKFWTAVVVSTALILLDIALVLMSAIPMWLFWVILVVSIVLIFVPILSFKGAQASVSDGRLRIKAPFVDLDIPLSSIQAVECRTTFDIGLRMYGYGGFSSGSGDFTNKEFGSYRLAIHNDVGLCIVVHLVDGNVVVFNVDSEESTRTFYADLVDVLDGDVTPMILRMPTGACLL